MKVYMKVGYSAGYAARREGCARRCENPIRFFVSRRFRVGTQHCSRNTDAYFTVLTAHSFIHSLDQLIEFEKCLFSSTSVISNET